MKSWLPIKGYEGLYSVSDDGDIRSEDRKVFHHAAKFKCIKGRDLIPCMTTTGYHMVSLSKDGKSKKRLIHTIVLNEFVGPPPHLYEACHGNNVRTDNRLSNLRWDSRKNNHHDKIGHGTSNRGERCGTAKLTEAQVKEIIADTRSQYLIAKEYGIRQPHVSRLKNGVRWAHLEK